MQETVLELKNYSVSFDTPDGEVQAVRNVDLSVKKGEILCIVGESGCGKTTVGRSLVRLYEPTAGQIFFDGQDIAHMGEKQLAPYRRRMQMIFQGEKWRNPAVRRKHYRL